MDRQHRQPKHYKQHRQHDGRFCLYKTGGFTCSCDALGGVDRAKPKSRNLAAFSFRRLATGVKGSCLDVSAQDLLRMAVGSKTVGHVTEDRKGLLGKVKAALRAEMKLHKKKHLFYTLVGVGVLSAVNLGCIGIGMAMSMDEMLRKWSGGAPGDGVSWGCTRRQEQPGAVGSRPEQNDL